MSTETAFPALDLQIQSPVVKREQFWQRLTLVSLFICLSLTLIGRVLLIAHTNGVIDGDESLVGIQAQHILHGERPVYFYNQPYMGSFEAYLSAPFLAIFGSSTQVLRLELVLVSMILVRLTWRLAMLLTEGVKIPVFARFNFVTIAGLFAAIAPLYDAVGELHVYGAYMEAYAQ